MMLPEVNENFDDFHEASNILYRNMKLLDGMNNCMQSMPNSYCTVYDLSHCLLLNNVSYSA